MHREAVVEGEADGACSWSGGGRDGHNCTCSCLGSVSFAPPTSLCLLVLNDHLSSCMAGRQLRRCSIVVERLLVVRASAAFSLGALWHWEPHSSSSLLCTSTAFLAHKLPHAACSLGNPADAAMNAGTVLC